MTFGGTLALAGLYEEMQQAVDTWETHHGDVTDCFACYEAVQDRFRGVLKAMASGELTRHDAEIVKISGEAFDTWPVDTKGEWIVDPAWDDFDEDVAKDYGFDEPWEMNR